MNSELQRFFYHYSPQILKVLRNALDDEDIDRDGFLNRSEFSRY